VLRRREGKIAPCQPLNRRGRGWGKATVLCECAPATKYCQALVLQEWTFFKQRFILVIAPIPSKRVLLCPRREGFVSLS